MPRGPRQRAPGAEALSISRDPRGGGKQRRRACSGNPYAPVRRQLARQDSYSKSDAADGAARTRPTLRKEPIERELIRRACRGDGRAVQALYDRYSPRVYAVVRRIAADDQLAEDYAQEAWIRAIRALPTFRGEARFSTWLHRIAVNSALQEVRKYRNRNQREVAMTDTVSVGPAPGDALLARRLQAALDELPPGMRQVLVLHDVEGYTHREIGEALGVASGTSKSQLFKARARMRAILAQKRREKRKVNA